jgi:hypothetical protein
MYESKLMELVFYGDTVIFGDLWRVFRDDITHKFILIL